MSWDLLRRFVICLLVFSARLLSLRDASASSTGDFVENLNNDLNNETTRRNLIVLNQQCPLREKIANVRLSPKPNVLFIVSDQLRFDAIQIMQERLPLYENFTKIRTPNIDRLARMGVLFETAYCVSPSCGPSRTALKSGNSLQRSAIKGNRMIPQNVYGKMDWIEKRIMALETLEQMLVENETYTALTFGKWHVPLQLYYRRRDSAQKDLDIRENVYSFQDDQFGFRREQFFQPLYQKQLEYLVARDGVHPTISSGQVTRPGTRFPYTPIRIDPLYGKALQANIAGGDDDDDDDDDRWDERGAKVAGIESLPANYTQTAVLGQIALKALGELMESYEATQTPFSLQCHFSAPHPPKVALPEFSKYYLDRMSSLRLPPSIRDDMFNSAYAHANERKHIGKVKDYSFNDPDRIAELQAVYYGMIEEVDHWIGKLLDQLESRPETAKNTMIVFTSDHGDMMGAHGMVGKGVLLEEATRVVLMMAYPGRIPANRIVSTPVSHMDVTSTVLDYLGYSYLDHSDGASLRRYIDRRSYNENFDDRVVVSEIDKDIPLSSTAFRNSKEAPNLSILRGGYKLILPKSSKSDILDMMYDLNQDPYEMNNLLGANGMLAENWVVGKAEHLKVLLVEWMQRVDGPNHVYSDPKWTLNQGFGTLREVQLRRTWRKVNLWVSDRILTFGTPVLVGDQFRRNEYLYLGRTTDGELHITDVVIVGSNASLISTDWTAGSTRTLTRNQQLRIRVTLSSPSFANPSQLSATLCITNSATGTFNVTINGAQDM